VREARQKRVAVVAQQLADVLNENPALKALIEFGDIKITLTE